MSDTTILGLLVALVYAVPLVVIHVWPLAEPWMRGPHGSLWREETRDHPRFGRERWLVVWTPRVEDLEDVADWAVDQLDALPHLRFAEQQWPGDEP